MKKLLMLFVLLLISMCAMADDKVEPLVFNPISVEDQRYGDTGVKIDANQISKGVYITAVEGWSTVYPKTAELAKEIFKSKGLKVVDKPEDADIGFMLVAGQKLGSFASIEEDVGTASEAGRMGAQLLYAVGYNLVTGMFTATATGHFSANKNGLADIEFFVMKNPQSASRNKISGDDKKAVFSQLTFRVNRPWVKGDYFGARIFTKITSDFIDQHFTGLPALAPVAAASAVAPAIPVVNN